MDIKEKPEDLWKRWKTTQSPDDLRSAVSKFDRMVESSIGAQQSVNKELLRGQGKILVAEAIQSYDPSHNVQLSTHVYNHLRPIQRKSKNWLEVSPLSRHHSNDAAMLSRFEQDFFERNGREPDDTEIMDSLGVNRRRLSKLNQLVKYEVPESQVVGDVDMEDEDIDSQRLNLWTDYVYNDLDSTGKKILDLKLGRNGHPPLSNEEIALRLKITPLDVSKRAQQISEKILKGVNTREKEVYE